MIRIRVRDRTRMTDQSRRELTDGPVVAAVGWLVASTPWKEPLHAHLLCRRKQDDGCKQTCPDQQRHPRRLTHALSYRHGWEDINRRRILSRLVATGGALPDGFIHARGFRIVDTGSGIEDQRFRIQDSGSGIQDQRSRIKD